MSLQAELEQKSKFEKYEASQYTTTHIAKRCVSDLDISPISYTQI